MSDRPSAIIAGGSVGGLFAARLLHRAGWQATIYERSASDLAGRGAGVGITQELIDAMAAAGAPIDPSIGLSVESFVWLARDGRTQHEHRRAMGASAWVRIYQALRAGFPDADYVNGAVMTSVEQDTDSVTAVFQDGQRVAADLLVAADGSLSTVRQQILPDVVPGYAGYVAWRGVVDGGAISADARATIDGHIVFSFAPDARGGEMMLTMPVPDLTPSSSVGGRYYFIWYRPVHGADAMRDMFTDADGHDHGVSIPPPSIRSDVLDQLRADAGALFAPALTEVIKATPQPLLQAISDLAAPKLDFGRVALLGDAAFVARPHVAGGITKAAVDARTLVSALSANSRDLPAALAAYDQQQRDFGNRLVDHARYLGGFVEPGAAENAPTPEIIMRDYGAPHLLRDPAPEAFVRT